MFAELDLTKEEVNTDIDFGLLDEMFCRSKAEIEAEEAAKALAAKSKTTSTKVERSVLDAKIINDLAMTIMSLRIPAVEIY